VLPSGMQVVGSTVVLAAHSVSSSAAVVAASECWVSASRAAAIASKIEGAVFALASTAGSSAVA
jgi:hypothetical protein